MKNEKKGEHDTSFRAFKIRGMLPTLIACGKPDSNANNTCEMASMNKQGNKIIAFFYRFEFVD
jgi:hypothetical protein